MLIARKANSGRVWIDHDFGGHFPGIDNPPALASDLMAIGSYFK